MGFPIKATAFGHRRLAVAAFAIIASAGAVLAQADSDGTMRIEAPPITGLGQSEVAGSVAARGGERARSLRLDFAAKTVSFGIAETRDAITTRDIPFAPGAWEVTPETRRAMAEMRSAFRATAPKDAAFALVVTGGDEVVAYRRARALRGELIDRHREDPNRIIAAAGTGGGDGQTRVRVELILLDPSRCEGCGPTPLKTIALDSGVAKLVRANGDGAMIAASRQAPVTIPAPDPVAAAPLPPPRPITPRTEQAQKSQPQEAPGTGAQRETTKAEAREKRRAARAEQQERAREQAREDEATEPGRPQRTVRPPAVQPRREARAMVIAPSDYEPRRRGERISGGCGRPDIIIDDYYRGGPLIGCDGLHRRRR